MGKLVSDVQLKLHIGRIRQHAFMARVGEGRGDAISARKLVLSVLWRERLRICDFKVSTRLTFVHTKRTGYRIRITTASGENSSAINDQILFVTTACLNNKGDPAAVRSMFGIIVIMLL